MPDQDKEDKAAPVDRLNTRPDEPLPTPLDPQGPESRGGAKNPKKVPPTGQGDPNAKDPAPGDIDRTA